MKLHSVLAGVPLVGEELDFDMEITSISYDSRTVSHGSLFVALPGEKDDGQKYISQALERGAAAVLFRERPEGDGPWLVTPDPDRKSVV